MEHVHIHTPERGFKKYLPLISIFVLVGVITAVLVFLKESASLMYAMRMFMATFFIVFGLFKVAKLKDFAMAYREYDVIAMRSWMYAYVYPFIELFLGVAFYIGFAPLAVSWVTLIIMIISAYGVYIKLRKKEEIVCACLGTVFKVPMTYVTLGEDLVMAVMALIGIILMM